ncbi:MAG: EamA family transporter, partial [Actinomycetota bacterium]
MLVSLGAGVLQTARNGLARSLSGILPATLLSWARFAFNLPFAALLVVALYLLGTDGAPTLSMRFFALAAIGGAGQLLGNVALIEAFSSGTFAQAIVLHKTEAVLAAVVGALFFTQDPGGLGWVGIALSVLGVVLIGLASSDPPDPDDDDPSGSTGELLTALLTANRGTVLALASAGLLVVASFGV